MKLDPQLQPHIEARVRYLTPAEGGRSTPVTTGYQGRVLFGAETDHGAYHQLEADGPVEPGREVREVITLMDPDQVRARLAPGVEFLVREGRRVVASGVVTRVFPGW